MVVLRQKVLVFRRWMHSGGRLTDPALLLDIDQYPASLSYFFFFSRRRRHTIFKCESSDVCSSDLGKRETECSARTAGQISAQLKERGWEEGTRLSARSILSLVSPNVAATALPVLPRLNNGEPSALIFTRAHLNADERDVLRFWPTQYAVQHRGGQPPGPIWLGSLVHEPLLPAAWPLNGL